MADSAETSPKEHAPKDLFTNREFAFTLQGDVYLRYNCFSNAEELRKQAATIFLHLGALNPTRFEIGPMYSSRRKLARSVKSGKLFTPLKRELVFDIDMTDYDGVRTCCTSAGICKRCWAFIANAVRVLDSALRTQFGYHHLLWVYSGRRGIYLAVVGALTVIEGGKEMAKKVNVRGVARRATPEICHLLWSRMWYQLLDNQECFLSKDGWRTLLKLVPDKKIPLSRTSFCNPRLDAEVSKHRNHLLKVPFCVCIPVDPNRVENFDPNAVPTVMQLLQELDKAGEGANWEHTSLKPYVDMLDRHVMGILDDVQRRERAKAVLQHTINSISSLPVSYDTSRQSITRETKK
ncbi:hypothetical protein C8R48DRAFT_751098 [Suillus tomentosus]|nr:hypothetical protein C8R48DRAFT_751098 [Suillus tomentosus]